jgi:FkbH-like protein
MGLVPVRVALLSSFSIEFIHDSLAGWAALDGMQAEIYQAGFAQYRQEILSAESGLYRFDPQVVILAVEGPQWMPDVYQRGMLLNSDEMSASCTRSLAQVRELIAAFRSRSSATVIVHNVDPPARPALGILDGRIGTGFREIVARFNLGLLEVVRNFDGVFVADYANLVADLGRERWYDPRMAHYAKAPLGQEALSRLARHYMRYLRARAGRNLKCVVLDLDNTLWGGIVGEDGVEGIQLGANYPGSAFVEFQRTLKELRARGVLLAIASKNNPADVQEVFDKNPNMVLAPTDFARVEISWQPKSESLQAIARALNIGLEHIAFVDDNPAEQAQIRQSLPSVTVIDLPQAPERYSEALLGAGLFDSLSFSDEDRRRTDLYRQRAEAQQLQQTTGSLDDYYRDLRMQTVVAAVDGSSLARAAQLTQKTNQFNATTIRYSESDVQARIGSGDWIVKTVQVADRFGDNGIVGVMMAQAKGDQLRVDTFLLSCRVIGRTVETGMLSVLCTEAIQRGLRRVSGRIAATPKNQPARDLFSRHGFTLVRGEPGSESEWELDLAQGKSVVSPDWLNLTNKS